ncbi:MAG: hypothetical protein GXO91_00900 [FCB group bacterium]|nr:hypothetical protein [FCB group bacterium]
MQSSFGPHQLIDLLPGLALYTEMHYRFRLTGSRYFKKEPEILADIPHRIDPGNQIPVILLVKDADRYPVFLKSALISMQDSEGEFYCDRHILGQTVDGHWWHQTLLISRPQRTGNIQVTVEIEYTLNGKSLRCTNHNLKLLPSKPFQVYLATDRLPGSSQVIWGDLHYHSNYTEDMVEFGAPLEPTMLAGRALGLDFIGVTDHSYDLDDRPSSWTETDPNLERWHQSRQEIERLNDRHNFSPFLIAAEEVTIHNSRGQNIHALVYDHDEFLPGQGDGAEIPFNFSCDYDTKTLFEHLPPKTLCIAAHPVIPVPLLERILIKRGVWEAQDVADSGLAGLQILNGTPDEGFYRGISFWVGQLLEGRKLYIYAGNDAHGNFNWFRQIKTPMLSLHEKKEQLLGVCRTGVFTELPPDQSSVLAALKSGCCIITNGPFINITLVVDKKQTRIGGTYCTETFPTAVTMQIEAQSTEEFGGLRRVRLFCGVPGEGERILYEKYFEEPVYLFETFFADHPGTSCYYRSEVQTVTECLALTNPIWLNRE